MSFAGNSTKDMETSTGQTQPQERGSNPQSPVPPATGSHSHVLGPPSHTQRTPVPPGMNKMPPRSHLQQCWDGLKAFSQWQSQGGFRGYEPKPRLPPA